MTLGYDGKLYILAFDHRGSFQKKFFGVEGDPSEEETARIAAAKGVIYEGMLAALAAGAPREAAGVLVDEQFGADVARKAQCATIVVLSKWDVTEIRLEDVRGASRFQAPTAPAEKRAGATAAEPT